MNVESMGDFSIITTAMAQNYPNPFNPTTTIMYSIPYDANVSLIIYNELGQEASRLVNERQTESKSSILIKRLFYTALKNYFGRKGFKKLSESLNLQNKNRIIIICLINDFLLFT